MTFRTPGVTILEPPSFPPSIVPVETAIPVFIGHTRNTPDVGLLKAVEINDLDEFVANFGSIDHSKDFTFDVIARVNADSSVVTEVVSTQINPTNDIFKYNLYHAMRLFYDNGGGRCYVISIGEHQVAEDGTKTLETAANVYTEALEALEIEDDPTLIVIPELAGMVGKDGNGNITAATAGPYEAVYNQALQQAFERKDRFVIIDVPLINSATSVRATINADMKDFRETLSDFGFDDRKFGAAYYPNIVTGVNAALLSQDGEGKSQVQVSVYEVVEDADLPDLSADSPPSPSFQGALHQLGIVERDTDANPITESVQRVNKYAGVYQDIITQLSNLEFTLPPSPAIAGIYANVDNQRGVFKAPANVTLASVVKPTLKIDNSAQDNMNVHTSGKAVNAIRTITDRGLVVWGARTLDANNLDFRYINVRRFFNFVEESVKKAMYRFVFEPNDANTWASARAAIENFLTVQWEVGALQGAKADDAFFVQVGLGQTMNSNDILEGKLKIRIGMAVVRPAEFIILEFTQILPTS